MSIKYLQPVAPPPANSLLANTYPQIKREFGALVEPFTLHAPVPPILAGVWMICREAELVGVVPRDYKEAVATAVSRINQCPYCVDAHTMMLYAGKNADAAAALSHEYVGVTTDARLNALIAWASATRTPGSPLLQNPPFSPQEAPEMIGTALFYHYINRMVSVLLGATPLPLNQPWLKGTLKRMAGLFFGFALRRPKVPGVSLALLPAAPLPPDFAWAKANPNVAGAFARFNAVVEHAGCSVLPEVVRSWAQDQIAHWNGEQPSMGRRWVEQALATLPAVHHPIGRLVLLTALAPYQVDHDVIAACRSNGMTDAALVSLLAWASLAAVRRVGGWTGAESGEHERRAQNRNAERRT